MKKIVRVLPLLAAVLTLFAASSMSVNAASNGLGVVPRKDYTVQQGKSISDTLYISNLSLTDGLEVELKMVDFGAQNETGTPALSLDDNAPDTPWSLKPFIKFPKTVSVAAGKSTNVPISITIPASQGAGSYYAAVRYSAVNPETKERVNISASTVSLIFVTVPGQAKEQLFLKQFGAYVSNPNQTNGEFKGFFFGSTPKEFAYRLQNNGNVAEQPSGSIVIKNMFGRTVKEIADANSRKQLVLIGQTRRIQTCIKESVLSSKAPSGQNIEEIVCDDPGLWPGRYTAQIALFYGLNGNNTQEVQATTSFWYIPTWFIVAVIALIIIAVGLIWLIRRAFDNRRPRYRR